MRAPENARACPGGEPGRLQIALGGGDEASITGAAVKHLLELSNERDQWLRRLLDAERAAYDLGAADGWKAALEHVHRVRQQDFQPIARLMLAMSGNDRPSLDELELKRWGPGGREHFADPRPGDRRAEQVRRDAYASGLIPAGKVHLGGRIIHQHYSPCIPACYAYQPGWYTYREAARIMATLPDCLNYQKEIAGLQRLADECESVAT